MAYDLHINRAEAIPLPDWQLADWQAAVSATEGVRLIAAQAHTLTNPQTGQVISLAKRDGDAEVYFPAEKMVPGFSLAQWFSHVCCSVPAGRSGASGLGRRRFVGNTFGSSDSRRWR